VARVSAPAAQALVLVSDEAPVPDGGTLTLGQAVRRALRFSPAVHAAALEIDAKRGEALQAGLRPNPRLANNWGSRNADFSVARGGLTSTEHIPSPGQIGGYLDSNPDIARWAEEMVLSGWAQEPGWATRSPSPEQIKPLFRLLQAQATAARARGVRSRALPRSCVGPSAPHWVLPPPCKVYHFTPISAGSPLSGTCSLRLPTCALPLHRLDLAASFEASAASVLCGSLSLRGGGQPPVRGYGKSRTTQGVET